MKKITAFLLAALLTLSFAGCGTGGDSSSGTGSATDPGSQPVKLTVGASPTPHAEILESVREQLAAQGIELEIIEFTDYVIPNTALADGDLDANFFQHQPYLTNFNQNNKTDLISAGSIHFEPLGLYPGKTASLEELPDNAVIAVPNDTSNEARALHLLESLGLITLREGAGLEATLIDITEKPEGLVIRELEAAQIPALIADVDFGIVNGNYALSAGISDTVLAVEESSSEAAKEFANIVAIRPDEKDDPRIAALIAALTSEETRAFIEERFSPNVIPVF